MTLTSLMQFVGNKAKGESQNGRYKKTKHTLESVAWRCSIKKGLRPAT